MILTIQLHQYFIWLFSFSCNFNYDSLFGVTSLVMRILFITQYFYPETFRGNDLVKGLVERGHEVTVLTGLPNYPKGSFFDGYGFKGPYSENYQGAKVIRVPLIPRGTSKGLQLIINYLSFAIFGSLIGPLVCRGKFDKIFVYQLSPVTVGIPAIAMKYIKKAPIYFWVTDLWPDSLFATNTVKSEFIIKLVSKLVRFIYAQCDKILISSRGFLSKIIEQKVSKEKIIYFPYWAEEFYYKSDLSQPSNIDNLPDGFNVMFAGNIGTSQAFETIIETADVLKNDQKINFIILGDGLQRKWAEEESERRKLKNVHFLGSKPVEMMPYYFKKSDALLVSLNSTPLFNITVPSKVQSYLASSKPIIGSIDGEASEVIKEANCGYTSKANDPKELAQNIKKMSDLSQEELNEFGNNGFIYFKNNFEREMLITKLEEIMH